MAEHEMPGDQPCRKIDLSLPVNGVEQGGADCLRIGRQIVEPLVLAREACRRHIEIASEIERHRSVQDATSARNR
jgi:hypothetical protein